jgi:hypothetical protein
VSNPYPPPSYDQDPWSRQPSQQPYPGGPGQGQGGYGPPQSPYPQQGGYPAPQMQPQQGGYPAPPAQQGYPQQGGYPVPAQQGYAPQGAQTPGGQAQLVLDLKYFPLNFIFALFKPKVAINGHEFPARWGRNAIPMPAGHHHVHVHVPYILPPQIGPADLQVPLQQGQSVELEYRAPVFAFSRGAMGPGPQPWNGMGITMALMGVPIALALLIFLITLIGIASS